MIDWDDAYSNSRHIENGDSFPSHWTRLAADFRSQWPNAQLDLAYGAAPRERFDLFHPAAEPKGVMVFVHGGYWLAFDKSIWSHLAAGALQCGWSVALPSYSLCPEVSIATIAGQIGAAIGEIAGRTAGPICLAGHSAGGQLIARLNCADFPLKPAVRARLARSLAISGLFDLRPLLRTAMNDRLGLDQASAAQESPALQLPVEGTIIDCWVGALERPEFRRQNALLGNIWHGLGASIRSFEREERHHFDIIEDLMDPRSPMLQALLSRAA